MWESHSGIYMIQLELYADQSGLFYGLSSMHCTPALAIEKGNSFESQNGVVVVQASKVELVALLDVIADRFLY